MQEEIGGIPFGPSGLIDAADWARDRLARFNLPFPPENRLQRARNMLEDLNAGRLRLARDDDRLLDRITEGQWTIVEQYIVARSLGRPGRVLTEPHRRKLEDILSGTDSADSDQNHLARNTQFELYVAALLTMGDVPAWIGEPDLRMEYLGRQCGIAAKRVRSLRQILRRADEGVEQLTTSNLPGFVAVNVDVLLKTAPGLSGPEATLAERLQVVERLESRMADQDRVLGTMTFGRDCIWDFSGVRPRADVSHSFRFTVHPRAESDERNGREFFRGLMGRINCRMQNL